MTEPAGVAGDASDIDSLVAAARAAEREGAWERAIGAYEAALARVPADDRPAQAAELLRWIGHVHRQRGDLEAASAMYEASMAVAEDHRLDDQLAHGLNSLAIVEQFRGGLHSAESLYIRAWRLAEQVDDPQLAVMIEQNLGTLANIRGDLETALLCYGSALERFRSLGNEHGAAWVLNNIGMAHVDLSRWEEAEACFDEAFRLADGLRDADTVGSVELNRAELYLRRGDTHRAREHCDRAFEIFSRLESKGRLAEAYKLYGILFRDTGKAGLAERHLGEAVELAAQCQDRLLEAEAESERAELFRVHERNREALACLNRAHELFSDLHASRELLDLDRRLDRLEELYLQVMRRWGESIESKDRYTAGHCQRVADLACRLAETLGIEGRELAWFRMGAFLHDVGKIDVPEEVLNKPGKLTPEEWDLMKSHTTAGDAIVAELDFPWDIRPIVRSHHERWDGTGYPDGLKGRAIPLPARILCVADVYDALTTTRSYRGALPREEALRIMERDAGRLFDPELFPIFRQLVEGPAPEPADGPKLRVVA